MIEFDVNDDKDRKIILTLINIEKSKPSDFSFGIYSLLLCLASTSITRYVLCTVTDLVLTLANTHLLEAEYNHKLFSILGSHSQPNYGSAFGSTSN